MKRVVLIAIIGLAYGLGQCHASGPGLNVAGEDTVKNWTFGGFTSLQINQVALVNWSPGGENAFSGIALVNVFADYKGGLWVWENKLDLGFGEMYTKTFGWQKNEDKIDLLSKVSRSIGTSKFSYAAEANFKTQFARGYKLPDDSTVISRFMAPGYLFLSVGFEYKPLEWLSFYLSPATGKLTFVTDQALADEGEFGVKAAERDNSGNVTVKGKRLNSEFGASFKLGLKKDIMKNLTVQTDLLLFNNYTDNDKVNRRKVDVDWQTTIDMKVNKWITVSLFTHLAYDYDTKQPIFVDGAPIYEIRPGGGGYVVDENGDKVQKKDALIEFKEVLGVGFSYKF